MDTYIHTYIHACICTYDYTHISVWDNKVYIYAGILHTFKWDKKCIFICKRTTCYIHMPKGVTYAYIGFVSNFELKDNVLVIGRLCLTYGDLHTIRTVIIII